MTNTKKIEHISIYFNINKEDFDALGPIGLHLAKTEPLYRKFERRKGIKDLKKQAFSKTALVKRAISEFVQRNRPKEDICQNCKFATHHCECKDWL